MRPAMRSKWTRVLPARTAWAGGALAILLCTFLIWEFGGNQTAGSQKAELSQSALMGRQDFNDNCASCHGLSGTGSDSGPPLVHQIYNPGHHPDESFFRAVQFGSPQHHWRFGAMPPQPQVSERQVSGIIAYIRGLQSASGVRFSPHTMGPPTGSQ